MKKTGKIIIHIILTCVLLYAGFLGMKKIGEMKKPIKRKRPKPLPPLVKVIKVKRQDRNMIVRGEGTVNPMKTIEIVPEVSGKLIYVSPSMVNGGTFKKGELLFKIDPRDYELNLRLSDAKVKDAESRLWLLKEQAESAREEWKTVYGHKSPPPLLIKEPEIMAASARLDAEKASLEKAILNLERTTIHAPFDGIVVWENLDEGQYVMPGKAVASISSTEAVEIKVPLQSKELAFIDVPGFTTTESKGSVAKIIGNISGKDHIWRGRVVRSEGRIDERSRMIDVTIRVDNPYKRLPPLALGLYVKAEIEGHYMKDIIVIPRDALRRGNIVWVVDRNSRLRFKKVEVLRIEGDEVFLRSGLSDGEKVVVSFHRIVTDGMRVRTFMEESW